MDKYSIDGHKLQYHGDRVQQWLNAKTEEEKLGVYPIYVEVSPVGHCNHRCTFCAVDYIGYRPRSIALETLQRTLRELGESGVRSVMFAGEGEPLLHKELAQAVNYAKEVGLDVGITTNGTQLTQGFIEECLPAISWIKVSLNGGNRDVYSKIHQTKPEDFDKVWRNLAGACIYRDIHKSSTVIGIQSVLLPENIDTIDELVLDAKHCGLNYVVIKPYSQHLSSITRLYEGIKYGDASKMAVELAQHNSEDFEVVTRYISMQAHDSDERGYSKCYSTPFLWAYVMATGDVYGCSAYLLDERFRYGNINTSSFREVWTSEARRKAIDFVENKLDISECRKNCRMDKVNRHLWDIKNPNTHKNFI